MQTLLDVGKLLLKEDVKARDTDSIVFRMAPMIFFAPVLTAFVVLPFSPYLTAGALGTGIIYYVALSSIDVIGVFMAGWGSNNKYALIGGLRSAAQMISYELPLVLLARRRGDADQCADAWLHWAPTLTSMSAVSARSPSRRSWRRRCVQSRPWLWFFILQPFGLIVYYICGLAETNRAPFDLPEAESELVAGYLTEYSGLRWAMFFLGEYGNMAIVSAVATAIFLGGWSGPGAAVGFWTSVFGSFFGQVVFNIIASFWFIAKMGVLLLAFIWVRSTLPRLRADQLMRFAWLFLIPLTLINILVTGVLLLLPLDQTPRLIISAAANWLMLLIVIGTFRRVTGLSPLGRQPRWLRAGGTGARPTSAPRPQQPPELAGASPRR